MNSSCKKTVVRNINSFAPFGPGELATLHSTYMHITDGQLLHQIPDVFKTSPCASSSSSFFFVRRGLRVGSRGAQKLSHGVWGGGLS